ncbi:hypothetical protein N8I74_05055 [Chitiniphilus purpureus]|uniref:Uncharacterized protein n=1 Tax=Chitiniphilus purpureus TaxID=2981137 RepID=A0ABY6DPS3_9NEIS|nr:hypothetical protein [Chitiniphilus sp. CD1]UXY16390.1 hypothetical protein N8I74_05055 [Chitiniphilus sp. CD1]
MSSLPLPHGKLVYFVRRGMERRSMTRRALPFITEEGLVLYDRRTGTDRRHGDDEPAYDGHRHADDGDEDGTPAAPGDVWPSPPHQVMTPRRRSVE